MLIRKRMFASVLVITLGMLACSKTAKFERTLKGALPSQCADVKVNDVGVFVSCTGYSEGEKARLVLTTYCSDLQQLNASGTQVSIESFEAGKPMKRLEMDNANSKCAFVEK